MHIQVFILRRKSHSLLDDPRNTKLRTVLENWKCGFVPGKVNFDCIEVSIHTVHRQQTS